MINCLCIIIKLENIISHHANYRLFGQYCPNLLFAQGYNKDKRKLVSSKDTVQVYTVQCILLDVNKNIAYILTQLRFVYRDVCDNTQSPENSLTFERGNIIPTPCSYKESGWWESSIHAKQTYGRTGCMDV